MEQQRHWLCYDDNQDWSKQACEELLLT